MNSRFVACVGVLVLCVTALGRGAGKSDVADAAMKGDKAALRTLLQQKADVNAPQVDGATALHWAVYRGDVEMADLLIRAGANVKAANREGVTPLAMASLYGNAPMISRLIKAGAEATEAGPTAQTMLMLAARNGNPDAISVLIEGGAKVNAQGDAARHDGADVGRRTEAPRSGQGAARWRRRFRREIRRRGSAAKLPGDPREHRAS